jgi:hypothetical protein
MRPILPTEGVACFESVEMLSMPFASIQSTRQKYRPNEVEERGRETMNIHKIYNCDVSGICSMMWIEAI